MNSRSAQTLLIVFAGVFFVIQALLGTLGVFSNNVATMVRYVTLVGVVICFSSAKLGLTFMIILFAYSDLLKRLMIFGGRFGGLDLITTRALTPLCLAALALGIGIRQIKKNEFFTKQNFFLLSIVFAYMGLKALSLRGAGLMGALQGVADGASYAILLYILPSAFKNIYEAVSWMKGLVVVMIPVCLYAFYQTLYGLSDFEVAYLASGFTSLVKHLDDVRLRAFSTLTDSSALAVAMAHCAHLSFSMMRTRRLLGRPYGFDVVNSSLLTLMFITCVVVTLVRGANMNWIMAFALVWFFRTPKRTLVFYISSFALFIGMCFAAPTLIVWITKWTPILLTKYGNTAVGENVFRLWTYIPRLEGFHGLVSADSNIWSLFGHGHLSHEDTVAGDRFSSHDLLSNTILQVGAVPVFLMLCFLVPVMIRIHKMVIHIENPAYHWVALVCLANLGSLGLHCLLQGDISVVFPINGMIWSFCGIMAFCVILDLKEKKQKSRMCSSAQEDEFDWEKTWSEAAESQIPHDGSVRNPLPAHAIPSRPRARLNSAHSHPYPKDVF